MPADRDRTIDALTSAFAAGELSMDEFEKRVETANRSDDEATLRRLLADLPRFAGDDRGQVSSANYTVSASSAAGTASTNSTTGADNTAWSRDWKQYADSMKDRYRHARGYEYRRKADQVAIFSSSRRIGRWTLPKRLDSVAIFGSCLIDMRQADISPEGGHIEAVGLFGSVQILVPPGLNVRVNGVSIFGSATGSGDIIGDSAAPWVEIEAVAIFGSVEVKVSR